MANPTSAFFSAGPSLVPSPVTATTCLCSKTVLSMMPAHQQEEAVEGVSTNECLCAFVWSDKLVTHL